LAVQRGLNMGVAMFIISEALFFLAIFWAFFHKQSKLWTETKLRGHPKALITKLFKETFKVASLIAEGIVTSLEILGVNQGMGNRGSKPDSYISVKEQRVDGFSVLNKYRKVYSKCQGNLVFIYYINYVNTIVEYIRQVQAYMFWFLLYKNQNNKPQIFLFSTLTSTNKNKTKDEASSEISYGSTNELNPYYVTGFTDGDGCFYVSISPDSKYKTGYRVKAQFQIGLHIKDLALLEEIQLFFGVGKISKLEAESVQFRVYAIEDLKVIVNHFEKYPLITNKVSDFLLFKQVVKLIEEREHLTLDGVNKIISIKAVLNKGQESKNFNLAPVGWASPTPPSLNPGPTGSGRGLALPNLEPVLRPEIKDSKIQNLHWLAGFTDAEGCFFVALKKSRGSKLGETVWLKFILTQHTRDEYLLRSLITTFNCGRYIPKSGYGEFVVEKFTDVNDKVIPFFEKFKLHGIKSNNFEDFKKAALLIKNKDHLTREGLDKIKKLKGGMNKNRV
jgi:hypothetical protein